MDKDKIIKDFVELHKIIHDFHEQVAKFQWINVKDRLPPEKENVLFFNGKSEVRFGFFIADPPPIDNWASDTSIWINDLSFDEIGTATHWMPLPKPPEEK